VYAAVRGVPVAVRWQDLAKAEEGRCEFILEAYVMSTETPSEVLNIHGIAKGEDAPYERIIEYRDMIAHSQQSALAILNILAPVQHVQEVIQAGDLDIVKAVKETAGEGADGSHDGRRGKPPWQARSRGRRRPGHDVLITEVTGGCNYS